MKTIYVGCALQGVPTTFLEEVEQFLQDLGQYGTVLRFAGTSNEITAREVYETDIAMAAEADLMIAICDIPSTGLGMEIAKRIELKRPTIIIHQKGKNISRMVLGVCELDASCELLMYERLADLLPAAAAKLAI